MENKNLKKMWLKISLNPQNPADAELIKIFSVAPNKNTHVKLALYHHFNILDKLFQKNNPQGVKQLKNTLCNAELTAELTDEEKKQEKDRVFSQAF